MENEVKITAHIENVKPLIRQKGDLIKLELTMPFNVATWSALGPMIGEHAEVVMQKLSKEEAAARGVGQGALPFDGESEGESEGESDLGGDN